MQKFEPIRNDRINSAKTLSELFDLWRKEHENDEAFRQYEKRGVEKTSFECDGIINEETYNKQKSKVLFIAKEGNMGGRDTNAVVNKTDDSFWFRGVVEGKNKRNLFARRIIMLCNALSNGYYDKVDSRSLDAMSGAAFMNLNKRGGYSYCDWNVLEAYTIRFSEYIRKEINLIDPDIIVCCGRGVEYLLREHVFKDSCNIPKLIEVYHPSYFRISDKEYLRLFEIATNGESLEKPNALTENRQISVPAKAEASNNIRGIIFDTDAAYEPHATDEMLSPGAAVIMAFGSARKTLRYFNRGDYVYYYYKGVGIIAVGIIEDAPDSSEDVYERKVRTIVEPVKKNGEYIGVKADREFKGLATGRNGGFWLYGTTKKPYIYGKENNERAADEIRKKIAAAKN